MHQLNKTQNGDAQSFASEADDERRAGDRTTSIYRPALIETEDFAGFCLIRNISPGGMMGSVYADFASEQPVRVQFHPEYTMEGFIAWSKDKRIGIRFNHDIDVDKVLHDLGSREIGGKLNRAPRLPIQCQGELVIEKRVVPVTVQDISQRGLKVAGSSVCLGDEVIVRLEGLEPHKAIVRWVQGGAAGLNFIMPLGFGQLAEWVIGLQSGQADH